MTSHAGSFESLQVTIAYQFQDIDLLRLALTHRSYGKPNNERLEFLGDAILGSIVADLLFKQNSTAQEGELTQQRASMVNGKNLATLARNLRLDKVMLLGQGENRDQISEAILEDAMEALVGAVFLDSDFDCCRKIFTPIIEKEWEEISAAGLLKDGKTQLQELMQSQQASLPHYSLENTEGPDHDKHFMVKVEISSPKLAARGEGSSRKSAEQAAAIALLTMLQSTADK